MNQQTHDDHNQDQEEVSDDAQQPAQQPEPQQPNWEALARQAAADLHNYKAHTEKQRAQDRASDRIALFRSIINEVDNLERALAHAPENPTDWEQGMIMTLQSLIRNLESQGLTKIPIIPNESTFDPTMHQAIHHSQGPKDIITEVIQNGYTLAPDHTMIRTAQVAVGDGNQTQ